MRWKVVGFFDDGSNCSVIKNTLAEQAVGRTGYSGTRDCHCQDNTGDQVVLLGAVGCYGKQTLGQGFRFQQHFW